MSNQLAKKIEILNNENGALSKQLADSKKANVKKKTAVTNTNDVKEIKSEITTNDETPKADTTVGRTDKLKEKSVKTAEPSKPRPVVAIQKATSSSKDTNNKTITPVKSKAPLSQMDAIVEAMKAAKK